MQLNANNPVTNLVRTLIITAGFIYDLSITVTFYML